MSGLPVAHHLNLSATRSTDEIPALVHHQAVVLRLAERVGQTPQTSYSYLYDPTRTWYFIQNRPGGFERALYAGRPKTGDPKIGKVNEATLEWGGTIYDRKHFFHRPRGLFHSLLSPENRFFAPDGREYTWRRHGKKTVGIDNLSVEDVKTKEVVLYFEDVRPEQSAQLTVGANGLRIVEFLILLLLQVRYELAELRRRSQRGPHEDDFDQTAF